MRHGRRRTGRFGFGLTVLLLMIAWLANLKTPIVAPLIEPSRLGTTSSGRGLARNPCLWDRIRKARQIPTWARGGARSLLVCATPDDCAALVTYSEGDVRAVAEALAAWQAESPTTFGAEEPGGFPPPAVIFEPAADPRTIFLVEARSMQQTIGPLHLCG
jgi:hypothetical protein